MVHDGSNEFNTHGQVTMVQFAQGDTAFFVESNWRIREVRILSISGEFATIHFVDGEGGTRLRLNRLYKTKEEAAANMRKRTR